MLIRDNAFTQRGGDTVVLEKLHGELTAKGHQVTICLDGNFRAADFDIAHLFNFATAEKTEKLARLCVERSMKFVVTTLYEDWPKFFNQMIIQELLLSGYVRCGQPRDEWNKNRRTALKANPSSIQDNSYAALAAQVLVASGYEECVTLRRDYPNAGPIETCYFGKDNSQYSDDGKLFRETYGEEDFILCVGRLEQRKNQLSLLKAFEESPRTIVFAAGGFSYEQNYAESCKNFKRRGKNIFLDRISSELLASCYEAAAVHALPSWYELPGLVSLEAASRGVPCVVTDYGTIRDYLGDSACYCSPGDTEDIFRVTETAIARGRLRGQRPNLDSFTWRRSSERMEEIYKQAMSLELRTGELTALPVLEKVNSEKVCNPEDLLQESPMVLELIRQIRK